MFKIPLKLVRTSLAWWWLEDLLAVEEVWCNSFPPGVPEPAKRDILFREMSSANVLPAPTMWEGVHHLEENQNTEASE